MVNDPAVSIIAERIDARIRICRLAIEAVVAAHREFTAGAAGQLATDSQTTAFWELSGRCIALSNAYLALLELGYCAEATVIARALHEAVMLTNAIGDTENENIAKKCWRTNTCLPVKPARASK